MQKIADYLIRKHGLHDSFYIVDRSVLTRKIVEWRSYLPNIEPFYAVKCNPNENMIKDMIHNGFGFDCASRTEIDLVTRLGARKSKIIYAHPYKRTNELEHAVKLGIKYTTFDSVSELHKIKGHAPNINCLIRLRVDNPTARVQLGLKYGVRRDEYKTLIDTARDMGLNLIGCSFHVGSASKDPLVFKDGVEFSRDVFEYAKEKGYMFNMLDVGGGFNRDTFVPAANVLNMSIGESFKGMKDLRIIAEPGRYFAEDVFTFVVPVIGQRTRDGIPSYWIADGLYGSFNCMLYDGQIPTFKVLRNPLLPKYTGSGDEVDSVIMGSTCDVADRLGDFKLPLLRDGDFLMIEGFGSYTIAGAMNFNGIPMSNVKMFYIE